MNQVQESDTKHEGSKKNDSKLNDNSTKTSPNVDSNTNSNLSDVDWFLKNEAMKYGNGKDDIESGNHKDSVARAAVAIATAFGETSDKGDQDSLSEDKKRSKKAKKSKKSKKRNLSESNNEDSNNMSSEDEDDKVSKKLKSIRNAELSNQLKEVVVNTTGDEDEHGDDDSMAVDPELATLDEVENTEKDENKKNVHKDSDSTNHELNDIHTNENLVRKAIIESDSISQNPDFQQYLNTDGGDHESIKEKKIRTGTTDDYSHTQIPSIETEHKDDKDDQDIKKDSKQEYREVLPKVNETTDYNITGDMSELIKTAAAKASESIPTSSQTSGKSFDSSEEAALEQFVEEYQKIKGMTRRDVCERIWSNERRKDDFWVNICKVLPYRTRSSIYKHVRRKYHIFEQRGKWNVEEEKELARLCIEKEGQWSEIGKALGRMPEDCRDRWRNYVKCGPNRSSHKWSPEEEKQLKDVIDAILDENNVENEKYIQEQSDQARDRGVSGEALEELIKNYRNQLEAKPFRDIINWTVVSERMGGTRSRIQCRYKWNKLMRKEALEKVDSMSNSDKKWLLQKLTDLGFTEDSQIDWEELATLKPDLNLNGSELKLCYEKMRSKIKNVKDKNINDISKELLINFDEHFDNK